MMAEVINASSVIVHGLPAWVLGIHCTVEASD